MTRLMALGARAPLERYPPVAQERITALRDQAREAGHDWAPRPAGRRSGVAGEDAPEDEDGFGVALVLAGMFLLTVGIWLVGAGYLLSRLVRAIT